MLFSTHSVPMDDARRSGPRDVDWGEGGAYAAQHTAVAERVMAAVAEDVPEAAGIAWQLVYQSRSGPPTQPWLEPDVCDVIATLPAEGAQAVAIVPLGFVSDHMEVLWDLDTEAMDAAAEAGLRAVRTPTPGIDPAYVAGLVDLIEERLRGHARRGPPARDGARPLVRRLPPRLLREHPGRLQARRLRPGSLGLTPCASTSRPTTPASSSPRSCSTT